MRPGLHLIDCAVGIPQVREFGEVVSGTEVVAVGLDDQHPRVVIAIKIVEDEVQLITEFDRQGVALLGPVQRQRGDPIGLFVDQCF